MNAVSIRVIFLFVSATAASVALAWQGNHTLYEDPLQVGAYIADAKPLILVSAKRYGWTIKNEAPGRVAVYIKRDGFEVDADVLYDKTRIAIQSQGPRVAPDCVERCEVTAQSIQWLVNLRRAIALELHALAIKDAGGVANGRYFEPNLDEFRSVVTGDDARAINLAAANISRGYIHEREYLDIAAARAWQLKDTEDKALANSALRLVKAIAKSDGPRYKNMIAELANREVDPKHRRHLTGALESIAESASDGESYQP